MATHGPRFKRLGYRDQGNASLEAITEHWRDFTFTSGPVVVCLEGKWGKPRVWASSEAEGKRVLMHAAAIASYDPTSDPGARWAIWDGSARGTVNGLTYGVRKLRDGAIAVSKRDGPAGAPEVVVPAQP